MKTSKVAKTKPNEPLPAHPPEKTPPWAPKQGEKPTKGARAGRKTVADLFRAFARNENVSDAMTAVKWLLRLRGFKKDEADCWIFIHKRLFGHAELFVDSDDRQVLFIAAEKFKAHLKVERRKATRRQKLLPVTSIEDEYKEGLLFDWLKPQELSKAELELAAEWQTEMASIKKAADYLKGLTKFPELLEQMRAALLKK